MARILFACAALICVLPVGAAASSWRCSREARLARCMHPMLSPERVARFRRDVSQPSHPLFLVDRARPIPADFPLGREQTWRRCDVPPPVKRADLMCLPQAYTNRAAVLRGMAWDAPRPKNIRQTADGKRVGYRGRVGFKAMLDEARQQAGHHIVVTSAFRPHAVQKAIFEDHVRRQMSSGATMGEATALSALYSAQPGHSEHQLGTTADLTYRLADGSNSGFGGFMAERMHHSAPMRWVRDNAHRFGIVLTYRRDRLTETQYAWEPWHWRFVGVEAADAMRQCDLSVAEFLEHIHGVAPPPPFAHHERLERFDVHVSPESKTVVVGPGQRLTLGWQLEYLGSHPVEHMRMMAGPRTIAAQHGPLRTRWRTCITPGQHLRIERLVTAPSQSGIYPYTWSLGLGPRAPNIRLSARVVVIPKATIPTEVSP